MVARPHAGRPGCRRLCAGELTQNSQNDPLGRPATTAHKPCSQGLRDGSARAACDYAIIVLLSESSKKRPFQRYHAVQSLALVVVFLGCSSSRQHRIGVSSRSSLIRGAHRYFAFLCICPHLGGIALMLYYGLPGLQGPALCDSGADQLPDGPGLV